MTSQGRENWLEKFQQLFALAQVIHDHLNISSLQCPITQEIIREIIIIFKCCHNELTYIQNVCVCKYAVFFNISLYLRLFHLFFVLSCICNKFL